MQNAIRPSGLKNDIIKINSDKSSNGAQILSNVGCFLIGINTIGSSIYKNSSGDNYTSIFYNY